MPMHRERYPHNWEAISRRIRFERAGGVCEYPGCDARHGAVGYRGVDGTWYEEDGERYIPDEAMHRPPVTCVLTVAHIDHDTTNNADDNLRAWCQYHHLRHDAQHHARNAAATRQARRAVATLPGLEGEA